MFCRFFIYKIMNLLPGLILITIENIVNGGYCSTQAFCTKNKWKEEVFLIETEIIQGNLIATLEVFHKEYSLSFEVKLTKSMQSYSNIIEISGIGMPYGFYNIQGLYFQISSNGNLLICYEEKCKDPRQRIENDWSSIKVSQKSQNGTFLIQLNDVVMPNDYFYYPAEYLNVNIYISSSRLHQPGSIRNLKITSGSSGHIMKTYPNCAGLYLTKFNEENANEFLCNSTDLTNEPSVWNTCDTFCATILMNITSEYCEFTIRQVENNTNQICSYISCGNSLFLLNTTTTYYALQYSHFVYEEFVVTFDVYLERNGDRDILVLQHDDIENFLRFSTFKNSESDAIINIVFEDNNVNPSNFLILNLNNWYSIEAKRQRYNDSYINTITVNESLAYIAVSNEKKVYSEITVELCPINYENPCKIKNFYIASKRQVSWMQWSEWSSCNVSDGNGFMNRSRRCNVGNVRNCCSGNSFDFQNCYSFWTQWSNWSRCNISYGVGFINRTRECNSSNSTMSCPGNKIELMNCCFDETFKGNFSDAMSCCLNETFQVPWSDWSSCNVSYGNGFINRSRECSVMNFTRCCFENSFDFDNCYAFWSQWSNWSSCNISYGIGFMNRTRICDASHIMNCPGNTTEYMNCCFNETFQGNFSEVLNCCLNETFEVSWMQWSNWSSCNVSYGNGFMNRSRECNVDNSTMCCSDNSFDFQSCYGFWSQWSNWSHCNISYGIGFMNRTRECNVSIPTMWCPGLSTELMNCCLKETFKDNFDVKNCCLNKTIIVTWSQWSLWSACNTSYLNGLMDSSRKCNFDIPVCCSGESFRFQTCSEWSTWSECSATCGNGYRTQSSTYKKRVTNTESCNLRNCPVDGVWGAWKKSNCSSTCGAGDVTFSRDCDPPPSDNGRNCMGISNYTQDCDNEIICPENGVWSDWTFWSLCNQPCEGGEMSRFRTCFPPKYGGQYCNGNDSESIECQPKSCKIVVLNLLLYFPDVQYTSDYSDLGNKIEQAIAKLYKKSFRIEFHYFIDGNSDFFDSAV